MIFILFYQFLGDHVPELGALSTQVAFVAFLCFIFYKIGRHESDKKWKYDVERNPKFVAQEIREAYERRIVELETRNKYLEARHDVVVPAINNTAHAMAVIAEHFAKEAKGSQT